MNKRIAILILTLMALISCAPTSAPNQLSAPVVDVFGVMSPPLPTSASPQSSTTPQTLTPSPPLTSDPTEPGKQLPVPLGMNNDNGQLNLTRVSTEDQPSLEFVGTDDTVFIAGQDSSGNVVTNFESLQPGVYTITFSKSGYDPKIATVTIKVKEKVVIQVPDLTRISGDTSNIAPIQFNGGSFKFTILIVNTVTNIFITNISQLSGGTYRVIFVKSGFASQTTTVSTQPGIVIQITVPTPILAQPTTTPSSGPAPGLCWVNGYYRKNGTWVNGYWRRC